MARKKSTLPGVVITDPALHEEAQALARGMMGLSAAEKQLRLRTLLEMYQIPFREDFDQAERDIQTVASASRCAAILLKNGWKIGSQVRYGNDEAEITKVLFDFRVSVKVPAANRTFANVNPVGLK